MSQPSAPSASSAFDIPPPNLSQERLLALLEEHYGKTGSLKQLVSERDQNMRLDEKDEATGKDRRYTVKIANKGEDKALLDLQIAALEHLQAVDPSLALPQILCSKTGDSLIQLPEADGGNWMRTVSYLDGVTFADCEKTKKLRHALGQTMGRLTRALQGFGHPAAHQPDFLWNLDNVDACRAFIPDIADEANRAMAARFFDLYDILTKPLLSQLPGAIIHHDANDLNLIVDEQKGTVGLIDFGDMVYSRRVNELAVTLAYALMESDDLISDGSDIVAAYCAECPLNDDEMAVLPMQMAMRLVMSVCISSHRAESYPDNAYLTISQQPAFDLLARLDRLNLRFVAAAWRKAAGKCATANGDKVLPWLKANQGNFAPIFARPLKREARILVSYAKGAEGLELLSDGDAHWAFIQQKMTETEATYAIGLYAEDRDCYRTDAFKSREGSGWRSTHLGFDVFIDVDTPIFAPLDGEVVSVVNNAEYQNYGPTVILKHQAGDTGSHFFTLYGHLSLATLDLLTSGQQVKAGDPIGYIGDASVNVGWAPHLHFQIILDLLGETGDFYGVGEPNRMDVWGDICPDPNLIIDFHPAAFETDATSASALKARRDKAIGPSLSLSYKQPLKIVGGKGQFLIDQSGREYLDLVNNICHVGHCHPHVVESLTRQARELNTNTRYLHNTIINYAERLAATLPDPLSVVYLTCSGSEANELAMRMARTVSGNSDMICVNWGYHGNTAANVAVSPYKFDRKGGAGCPDNTQIAEMPDPYRGRFKGYGLDSGRAYAQDVGECIAAIQTKGHQGPAGFIAESMLGCGGQVVLPDGYLAHAYDQVRAAGGLCIADEVQIGFGRDGEHMWGFEYQKVTPDIVTMGKPIGNGHPMAAVVTTPEIARAFANGMEYFNSFGGNPVSCAVGMAVLDVIEQEGLQDNALKMGTYFQQGLKALADKYPLIGDVRGRGLYIGAELVEDRESLEPATEKAGRIINFMKNEAVLLSTDGPYDNVLKIKPPICIKAEHIDEVIEKLDRAFAAL